MGPTLNWSRKRSFPNSSCSHRILSITSCGLPTSNAYGISVGALRARARQMGPDHRLAMKLWKTGSLEARILAPRKPDPTGTVFRSGAFVIVRTPAAGGAPPVGPPASDEG